MKLIKFFTINAAKIWDKKMKESKTVDRGLYMSKADPARDPPGVDEIAIADSASK